MPDLKKHDECRLYTAAQTRELDHAAIYGQGIPGFELMKRAGRAAYRALRRNWPQVQRITVLCGGGNNGGDGFIIAGLALEQQLEVELFTVGPEDYCERLKGEAKEAYLWAKGRGVNVEPLQQHTNISGELIVDALLGTGLTGPVRQRFSDAITRVNAAYRPVLAVDVPSGLCSDTGVVLGSAVKADLTISFIGLKRGLFTYQGVDHCGKILFDDLGVAPTLYDQVTPSCLRICDRDLTRWLPARQRSAHKGVHGHVLVVGGDYGMSGAVLMAAQAAARSGAGLVSVATRPEHVMSCVSRCPELMVYGVRGGHDLSLLIERADVVLVGPGLGQSAWSGQLLHALNELDRPLVVDADALNLLNEGELIEDRGGRNWVLTPHPGEAARLLGQTVAELQGDRFQAVRTLQARYGGVCVLKGAGSLISDGQRIHLCSRGNPGMGAGGMGDILGGAIAALIAQGLPLFRAASAAVHAHAWAGDLEAQSQGERGMLATDLLPYLRRLLNPEIHPNSYEE